MNLISGSMLQRSHCHHAPLGSIGGGNWPCLHTDGSGIIAATIIVLDNILCQFLQLLRCIDRHKTGEILADVGACFTLF